MRTKAAVLWGVDEEWTVEEVELGDPVSSEVQVQLADQRHRLRDVLPAHPADDREGQLKLDELVTSTYALEDINQGYQDMRDGRNPRGLVVYTDADRG